MWYGKPTLKDTFEKFKKKPNYVNAEKLINEAEKRKIIVDRVSKKYRAIDKKEIAKQNMISCNVISVYWNITSFS